MIGSELWHIYALVFAAVLFGLAALFFVIAFVRMGGG